jgi:hypothetical protein
MSRLLKEKNHKAKGGGMGKKPKVYWGWVEKINKKTFDAIIKDHFHNDREWEVRFNLNKMIEPHRLRIQKNSIIRWVIMEGDRERDFVTLIKYPQLSKKEMKESEERKKEFEAWIKRGIEESQIHFP